MAQLLNLGDSLLLQILLLLLSGPRPFCPSGLELTAILYPPCHLLCPGPVNQAGPTQIIQRTVSIPCLKLPQPCFLPRASRLCPAWLLTTSWPPPTPPLPLVSGDICKAVLIDIPEPRIPRIYSPRHLKRLQIRAWTSISTTRASGLKCEFLNPPQTC